MSETFIIGIDFGQQRIGVAVSDSRKKIAFPLDVIHRENKSYGLNKLKRLLDDKDIDSFVVGVPYRENGELGAEGLEVLEYIKSLKEYFQVSVITWDERYTSMIAESAMLSDDVSRKGRRAVIDKIAAQIILQSYLDSLHSS
ncbi:MAG: Holliday junction resolvase RuvX [Spirochaetes bacterium]|nr:Holliday junction resolvase RuvX [Spirochaetota bacterium]